MKTYKVGFDYLNSGFAVIPEADDRDIARAMAVELLKDVRSAVITSITEYDSPQEAADSFTEAQPEGKHYVN